MNGSTIEDELTSEVLYEPKLLLQKVVLHRWDSITDQFVDVSSRVGGFFSHHGVGRAAAFSDVDRDGRVDVVVSYNGGAAVLLRNESLGGHWLQVRAIGAGVAIACTY